MKNLERKVTSVSIKGTRSDIEHNQIQTIRRSNWNQSIAAELLGLQRTYLSRLLKQKNIQQGTEDS